MFNKLSAKIENVAWSDDPIPGDFGPGFDYLNALSMCQAAYEKEKDEKEKEENEEKARREMEEKSEKAEETLTEGGLGEDKSSHDALESPWSSHPGDQEPLERNTVTMNQSDVIPAT